MDDTTTARDNQLKRIPRDPFSYCLGGSCPLARCVREVKQHCRPAHRPSSRLLPDSSLTSPLPSRAVAPRIGSHCPPGHHRHYHRRCPSGRSLGSPAHSPLRHLLSRLPSALAPDTVYRFIGCLAAMSSSRGPLPQSVGLPWVPCSYPCPSCSGLTRWILPSRKAPSFKR